MSKESKCKYCRYLEQCQDIVEENSIYCMVHRRVPKKIELSEEKSNPISTYGSVSIEDLIEAAERLKKMPDYNDLLKENKDLRKKIDKAIEYIEKFIPIDTDTILMREKQRAYLLEILKGGSNE